jgi:hypothetical protein
MTVPFPGLSRLRQALQNPDPSQAFARLVPFSWRGELALFCAGMVASFLLAGFWYPYWRIADMDFWIVYNAFLLNTPLPQEFFDHPGYLTILLLSSWLRALHALGIVNVVSLNALPAVTDTAAYAQAWTAATRAGRVLSLLYALGFVVSFAYLLRAFIRDWRVAAFGAFLLAFSGGMAMEMRIMRTELLSAAFFDCALLMLFICANRGSRWWRPLAIGCASLLITLAMLNKIQFLFLLFALPILTLPFGERDTADGFWRTPRRAWPMLGAVAAVAVIAAVFAKDILVTGFLWQGPIALSMPVLAFGAQIYWPVFALWIAIGMTAFAVLWRVPIPESLAAMAAIVAGCCIGLLTLDIRYDTTTVVVVFHPLEAMFRWALASMPQLGEGHAFLSIEKLEFLLEAIVGVIARRTFVLSSSPRPTLFLEWFVIAATIVAIRRREWRLVLQVGVLMLADWGIDTLNMARGLKQEYFLLTDPLAIIAAALLVARMTDLQRHRWTYPVGVTLIVAHILVSQAEPVKHVFRTDGPEVLCEFHGYTLRLEQPAICKN